jgi:hypothetical protein
MPFAGARDYYPRILAIAQRQVALAQADDLERAIGLLEDRQVILRLAPPPTSADHLTIRQVIEMDRVLAGYIRERMISVRDESLSLGRGRVALSGYRPRPGQPSSHIDAQR